MQVEEVAGPRHRLQDAILPLLDEASDAGASPDRRHPGVAGEEVAKSPESTVLERMSVHRLISSALAACMCSAAPANRRPLKPLGHGKVRTRTSRVETSSLAKIPRSTECMLSISDSVHRFSDAPFVR
mmetsp:Transcript_26123/g.56561  ORF Transcript_26123/g.56561 Transcript_26123/m.56561 type:complete len:128 (-) Transcript_26123:523-906(-)